MSLFTDHKRVFLVLALVVAATLPLLSFDFGITEDERLHNSHGISILEYFLGQSDAAIRDPLDPEGRLTFLYDEQMNDVSGALNIYGGFFDLLCVTVYRYLGPAGEFETRHLINSLFGVLLIVVTGLTARSAGGWRAGILALLLAVTSPRIIAHSMNNPVDLPFAALYMCSLYFTIRFVSEFPHPTWKSWVPLLVFIPLAIDVRIAGLVLVVYLVLFAGVRSLSRLREWFRPLALSVAVGAAGYLLASVLWPLAHRNPLTTPLLALRLLSRVDTFNAYDLFDGAWIDRWELPWYFVPKWFVIGTPLFALMGLTLAPLLIRSRNAGTSDGPPIDRARLSMIAFAGLFPPLFIVLRNSYVYNDARHVLFAYPPLLVVCALAFEHVLRTLPRRTWKAGFALLVAATMLEPLYFMVRNHPNEGSYFSPLIGGVDGAWRRYEADFWGNSVREAVEWIQENTEPDPAAPVRVRLWYGDQTKGRYYIEKMPGTRYVAVKGDSADWDYQIVQTVGAKHAPRLLEEWPPFGTVYEVKADGTPLVAVLINPRTRSVQEVLDRVRAWAEADATHASWFALAAMLQQQGKHEEAARAFAVALQFEPRPVDRTARDYHDMGVGLIAAGFHEEAIGAYRLSLERYPDNAWAYNDICVSHNALEQWTEARQACEAALALDPDYELARNNLRVALAGLSAP